MNWRFWRQKHEKQGQPPNAVPLDLSARFDALERAMQLQILLMDDRTRIMADAMTAELQGLRTVMDKIAHDLAAIDAKVQGVRRPERRPIPAAELAVADGQDDLLLPPLPANDTPVERPDVDPMLLDALAKGRVGFGQIAVSSIPPRSPLLALMEFEAPLPLVDMATTDRLSELFPDAALLLDRFMMDAAASMVRAGQVPSDVPLLIPISPVSAQDAALANDFRRRFERATHGGGIIPLVSETGWIALVEAGPERMAALAGPRGEFALRVTGRNRIDHAAIGKLGVRYVLADAALLADAEKHALAPDIHPTDVARLFARSGVGLVAENVPDQVTTLGLLRNNITMGWGPALKSESSAEPAASIEDDVRDERADYRSYLRRAGS